MTGHPRSACYPVEVFLTQNIFRVHGGADLIFKPTVPTVTTSAAFKVRKERFHAGARRWPDALGQMLAVNASAAEGRRQSEYSLWCHSTCFSLGVLEVYTPGDAGLVWGCVSPPPPLPPGGPFCLLARGCACARTAWNGTLRGEAF